MRIKRALILILSSVALATLIEIAIAWSLAIARFPQRSGVATVKSGQTLWSCHIASSVGCERVTVIPFAQVATDPAGSTVPSYVELPDLQRNASATDPYAQGSYAHTGYVVAGWPWPCLLGMVHCDQPGRRFKPIMPRDPAYPPLQGRWSLVVARGTANALEARMLPFLPVWPWFAVDVMVLAVFIASAKLAVNFGHRSYRRRHCLCLGCGHPVRGSSRCPECGHCINPGAA